MAPLRGRMGDRASILYYQDRYHAFSHVDAERLQRNLAELAHGCDASVCTSASLAEDLRRAGADPLVVPHGVDVEQFSRDGEPPSDLDHLERPLIGCVGLIDEYVSFASLRAVADRLDRGTVVLVGPANTDTAPLNHPRIVLLGARPYETMPAYMSAFACCLIPFERTSLTAGVDPIKLREYLAAGRPVVASALPAIMPYGDVVKLVQDPDQFADAVISTLKEGNDSPEARRRRRERVVGETWDSVAALIREVLASLFERTPV
jgi:glycosyltransferase involved in cell wall biosynthesis